MKCAICNDTGWETTQVERFDRVALKKLLISGARRCACGAVPAATTVERKPVVAADIKRELANLEAKS